MVVRRLAGVGLITLLTVVSADAFKFDLHELMTQEVLKGLLQYWEPPAALKERKPEFTTAAIREISDANKAQDTDDCGGKNDFTVPAKPCTKFTRESLAAFEFLKDEPPWDHFDAENIAKGSDEMFRRRQDILTYMQEKNFVGARKELGRALHALQDFYAHSNWVELNVNLNLRYEARLGRELNAFSRGIPEVAGPKEATCSNETDLLPGLSRLTSGWFYAWWLSGRPSDMEPDKCRHGWEAVLNLQPGINKDDTGRPGFRGALDVAVEHSAMFVKIFLDHFKDDPVIIRGFLGHPEISFLDPPAVNAGQDTIYIHVHGAGFRDEPSWPKVLWDGKPLETNFINNTRLDAKLETADMAVPRTVNVSVEQPEVDGDGKPTGGTLKSNVVDFTIGADCPNAIRPHRHDPLYIDVNARMWNDTGAVVVAGQRLNIEVLPGSVVWRPGGLLTGAAGEATPLGDPSATPLNTLLWLDPQIRIDQAPIGTLIGMIVGEDLLDGSLRPTIPLVEKPQGVKYFPIKAGGQSVPMPATGRLYFGINDGLFTNNGGCFQARIVR